MPIRAPQFSVQARSPAQLFDEVQRQREEDPFNQILRQLFARERRRATGESQADVEAAMPNTPDLLLSAIFGSNIPQAQGVVGPAAPPVTPVPPPERIKDIF